MTLFSETVRFDGKEKFFWNDMWHPVLLAVSKNERARGKRNSSPGTWHGAAPRAKGKATSESYR